MNCRRWAISLIGIVGFSLLFSNHLLGQISWGDRSLSQEEWQKSLQRTRSLAIAKRSSVSLQRQEGAVYQPLSSSDLRVAYLPNSTFTVDLDANKWGNWAFVQETDMWVFRGTVSISGASSIALFFDYFSLPEGAELYIKSQKSGQTLGAFTDKNNNTYQDLQISPIQGEEIFVEYHVAPRYRHVNAWHIGRVVALYAQQDGLRLSEPLFINEGLGCAPNAILYPERNAQQRSTVLLLIRGAGVCSGTLINNTRNDGKAYVLTAAHCMNNGFEYYEDREYADESARQTIFFFNFFSPVGDRFFRGVREQTLSGARIVAFNEERDMCLLEITGVLPNAEGSCAIPPAYMPYFSGWNASEQPQPAYWGLHYPLGSVVRYSLVDGAIRIEDYDTSVMSWADSHWRVEKWAIGTTERGSSGSPLFDADGAIIGALSGGRSRCDAALSDHYYALCRTFLPAKENLKDTGLQPFLSPDDAQRTYCAGLDPFAPYAPERLSLAMYNVHRDRATSLEPLGQEEQAVGVSYHLSRDYRLLGLTLVVDTLYNPFAFDLQIGSGIGSMQKELFKASYTLPPFVERFSPTQYYIDLSSRNLSLEANSSLFVAIYPKSPSSLSLMGLPVRVHPSQGDAYAIDKSGKWQTFRDKGRYQLPWIDAIVQPKDAVSDRLPNRYTTMHPTILKEGDYLRILLPIKELDAPVPLVVYDLQGQRLYSTSMQDSDLRIAIRDLRNSESYWIFAFFWKGHWNASIFTPPTNN